MPRGHLSCVEELRIGTRACCTDAAGKVIASENDALVPKDGRRGNVAAINLADGPKVEQAHGALHLGARIADRGWPVRDANVS